MNFFFNRKFQFMASTPDNNSFIIKPKHQSVFGITIELTGTHCTWIIYNMLILQNHLYTNNFPILLEIYPCDCHG